MASVPDAGMDAEIARLRARVNELECDREAAQRASTLWEKAPLRNEEIDRYGRQLIMPRLGVSGQQKLKSGSVLVVGAGGLGCPAVLYLAGAGVGRIGVVDVDTVAASNLHRQIAHSTQRIGMHKVDSVREAALALNPYVSVEVFREGLRSDNALAIVEEYDVVLDCTDNVPTRYLVNDAAVICGKPLVSGSALQWDGQLSVYGGGSEVPCYRCVHPVPPPPHTVGACSDNGVVGAVPGTIGTMQALEAIKILVGTGTTLAGRLLVWDGHDMRFRVVKLRPKRCVPPHELLR